MEITKQQIVTTIGDMTARMVESAMGPRAIPILIVVEATEDAEGEKTNIHCASSMPQELTQSVINALYKPEAAPGEATAEDVKAEDDVLSSLQPDSPPKA